MNSNFSHQILTKSNLSWLSYHTINLCNTLYFSCCSYTQWFSFCFYSMYPIKNSRRNIWEKGMKLHSGMYHLLYNKYPVYGSKLQFELIFKLSSSLWKHNLWAIKFSFAFVCFCGHELESKRQKTYQLWVRRTNLDLQELSVSGSIHLSSVAGSIIILIASLLYISLCSDCHSNQWLIKSSVQSSRSVWVTGLAVLSPGPLGASLIGF